MPKCKPKTRFIPATCAWALLLCATTLFYVFPCRYLTFEYHFAIPICQGVITVFVLANFTMATFMDPGVIPKANPDETKDDDFRVPLYKNVEINGITVRMKWCTTCRFYRPPRCSHCSVCNNCIDTFDHHCPWVNNCIGRRNYRHFFLFLVSLSIHMITIFAFCVVFLLDHTQQLDKTDTIVCIVIMVIIFCLIFPILGLTGFHVVLVSRGRTTNEQVTGKFRGGYNPFSRGCCKNVGYALCGPLYPSFLSMGRPSKGKKSGSSSSLVNHPSSLNNPNHPNTSHQQIATIPMENQVRVYMDTSNGLRTSNLNAYNKMSQGPNVSDTDLTLDTVDQSQSQDCEPTPPPCPRNGSKTTLFDTAEFREAIASSAAAAAAGGTARFNHLGPHGLNPASSGSNADPSSGSASYQLPVKVLPSLPSASARGTSGNGNNNVHGSPGSVVCPRVLGGGPRSRAGTPDPLSSPDGGGGRSSQHPPPSTRSPGSASRSPPFLASPVRRSNPGTPTTPRSPGFVKRQHNNGISGGGGGGSGSPSGGPCDPRTPPGYYCYPDVVTLRPRHHHHHQQPPYMPPTPNREVAATETGSVGSSIVDDGPKRKFASEGEPTVGRIPHDQQHQHQNQNYYSRTSNNSHLEHQVSDEFHEITGSPVRGGGNGGIASNPLYRPTNVTHQPFAYCQPHQLRSSSVGQSDFVQQQQQHPYPSALHHHPTSPTGSMVSATGRPPPFASSYGRRNSGSSSPQPRRKTYGGGGGGGASGTPPGVRQQQQQWSSSSGGLLPETGSGDVARGPPSGGGAARRPMSFVKALEVTDSISTINAPASATTTTTPRSPIGTPRTEHRMMMMMATMDHRQQQQQGGGTPPGGGGGGGVGGALGQQPQDGGDRGSFYDTNYEISV